MKGLFGMSCAFESLVFVIYCRFPYSQLGTSCALESPTLANEVSLRGDKMDA